MRYQIVTNNRSIQENDAKHVSFVEGDASAVFAAVEKLLQSGWKLLNAPLPPNVALIRSPFRSVVLGASETRYDVHGLIQLEKAKERTQTLHKSVLDSQLRDLEIIDRTFIHSAMDSLGISVRH